MLLRLFPVVLLSLPLAAQDGLAGKALRQALGDKADDLWVYDDLAAGLMALTCLHGARALWP